MKKKLLFLILCLTICLTLVMAATACQPDEKPEGPVDDGGTPTTPTADIKNITYQEADGVKYSDDNPVTVENGGSVVFSFSINVFYTGTPVVSVNGRERTTTYDGDTDKYSCKVSSITKDLVVTIDGIYKAESKLLSTGTGAEDSPFLIKEPIDLIKMAEIINSGAEDSTMSVLGYYSLQNSLDFKGEEIDIIGDGSTNYSFFGGYFNGNGHTISNFVINAKEDDYYVGLFGVVQAYDWLGFTGGTVYNLKLSDYTINANNTDGVLMCGSLIGQGFGANVYLCEATDGEINIYGSADEYAYAGGLVGVQRAYVYPYFSKVYYCSSENVNINCGAGTTFAAGGIVGWTYSSSETVIATVLNVYSTGNISGASNAGGIVGWLDTYTSVANAYSLGDISAETKINDEDYYEEYCYAYAGGIVGMARPGTSVVDCFAKGKLSANAAMGEAYAHTGEIVGKIAAVDDGNFSGREGSVYNCYYIGGDSAIDFTSPAVVKEKLFWHGFDWIMEEGKYPTINGETSSSSYSYVVTLDFGTVAVEGQNDDGKDIDLYKLEIEIVDQYEAMSFWYLINIGDSTTGIPRSIQAKDGYASYGYYFDKECTLAVPFGYAPTRNITLYVGFADNKEVAGTYYIIPEYTSGKKVLKPICLTVSVAGSYKSESETGSFEGTYVYDGEEIIFYDASFVRYYGESTLAGMEAYTYKGIVTEEGLTIFGGVFVDEETSETMILIPREEPLYAKNVAHAIAGSYCDSSSSSGDVFVFYADGTGEVEEYGKVVATFTYTIDGNNLTLTADGETGTATIEDGELKTLEGAPMVKTDEYRGVWEVSSLTRKIYEFNGAGIWHYYLYAYVYENADYDPDEQIIEQATGRYTISGDEIALDDGTIAKKGSDGLLTIVKAGTEYTYGRENSRFGEWVTSDGNMTIEFLGIAVDGIGQAKISYVRTLEGKSYNEIYYLTYTDDMQTKCGLWLYYGDMAFGMLAYDESSETISGYVYDTATEGYSEYTIYRKDEYRGEWIEDGETPLFVLLDFNGYGCYTIKGSPAPTGKIVINGEEVNYYLNDYTLSGYFRYGGQRYNIAYDEEKQTITITGKDGAESTLVRRDELGSKTYIDADNTEYTFDGKGELSVKGKLVVKSASGETEYAYVIADSDAVAKIYDAEGAEVGQITISNSDYGRNYCITIDGKAAVVGEKTKFTGEWALTASYYYTLTVGAMNLDGVLIAKIPLSAGGTEEAVCAMTDENYLTCTIEGYDSIYIIGNGDGKFVVSRYLNWFSYDKTSTDDDGNTVWNYSYAGAIDDLRGVWVNNIRYYQQYTFDGMGKYDETLGMYTVENTLAGDDDDDDEDETTTYYGYFERKDKTSVDYVIVTQYGSAFKVVFCDYDNSSDKVYRNEAEHKAFLLESVKPDEYNFIR